MFKILRLKLLIFLFKLKNRYFFKKQKILKKQKNFVRNFFEKVLIITHKIFLKNRYFFKKQKKNLPYTDIYLYMLRSIAVQELDRGLEVSQDAFEDYDWFNDYQTITKTETPLFTIFNRLFLIYCVYYVLYLMTNGGVFIPPTGASGWSWVGHPVPEMGTLSYGALGLIIMTVLDHFDGTFRLEHVAFLEIRFWIAYSCLRLSLVPTIMNHRMEAITFYPDIDETLSHGPLREYFFLLESMSPEEVNTLQQRAYAMLLFYLMFLYARIFVRPQKQELERHEDLNIKQRAATYKYMCTRAFMNEMALKSRAISFMKTPNQMISQQIYGQIHKPTRIAFGKLIHAESSAFIDFSSRIVFKNSKRYTQKYV